MNDFKTTSEQKNSISNYKKLGIDIEPLDSDTIKITQSRLLNGYILNQKQLHERAKEIFPDKHILPVVFSLNVKDINVKWIEKKMDEFGIKRKDLVKQLAFNKDILGLILSSKKELTNTEKSAFFYYFLCYELNNDFRENEIF